MLEISLRCRNIIIVWFIHYIGSIKTINMYSHHRIPLLINIFRF